MDYEEEIEQILKDIILVFELDLDKYVGAKTVRVDGHYELCKFVMECQRSLADDNIESAITNLYYQAKQEFVNSVKHEITFGSIIDKVIDNENSDFNDLIRIIRKIYEVYTHFNDNIRTKHLAGLKHHDIFKDDTFEEATLFNNVSLVLDAALDKGLFSLHSYKEGKSKISKNQEYYIYPHMGISYSLQEWLHWLESQMDFELKHDEAIVTCFMKMEYESSSFSYFVIAIHKGDSIWIATDQLNFYNPANKTGQARRSKSSGKDRANDGRNAHIGLPYELFENLNEIRKENGTLTTKDYCDPIDVKEDFEEYSKGKKKPWSMDGYYKRKKYFTDFFDLLLTKYKVDHSASEMHVDSTWDDRTGGRALLKGVHVATYNHEHKKLILYRNAEVLKYPMAKWDVECKLYLKYLIDRLLFKLKKNPQLEQVMIAAQNIEQKLIGQETFTHKETQLEYYEESHQKYVKDIVDNWEDKEEAKTTALAKLDYGLAFSNPDYDANWLGTPAAIDNVIKWSALDKMTDPVRNTIAKKWDDEEWRKDQHVQLQKLFQDNIEDYYKMMFLAPRIYTRYKGFSSWNTKDDYKYTDFVTAVSKFKTWTDLHMDFEPVVDLKYPYKHNDCPRCGEWSMKYYHHIHIRSWQQILLMIGKTTKDRQLLPQIYRCYQAHDQIPYKGNSLLNNTHPYTSLRDPFSERNPNGLTSKVLICGNCRVQLEKKYNNFDNYLLIDEETGDIVNDNFDPKTDFNEDKLKNHGHIISHDSYI